MLQYQVFGLSRNMVVVPVKVCGHLSPYFWQCKGSFTLGVPLAGMGYDMVQVHVGVSLLDVLLAIYWQVERIYLFG